MKNNKIAILSITAALLCMVSCTKTYLDRNTNPEQATDEMMGYDGLRIGARFANMASNVIPVYQNGETEYGTDRYQVIQGLSGDIFSGYYAASNSGFSQNNVYNLNPDGWDKAMFEDAYTRCMGPWIKLDQLRKENPSENMDEMAMADILKVTCMHRVTDAYGPIPYSKITSGSLKVAYDSQEDVYKAMFEELGNAIDVLTETINNTAGAKRLARYDNVFYGDLTKWVKFANTLRLRLALRVCYAAHDLYVTQAEAALANPYGFIEENVYLHPGAGAWQHPLYVIENEYNDGDAKVGATIVTYMNSYEDARRAKFFIAGSDGNYYGVRMGASVNDSYPKSSLWARTNCTKDSPMQWMSGAESFFLRAEHALRMDDAYTAESMYEAGVQQSFTITGAGDATSYLATETPVGKYTDPVNNSNSYGTDLTSVSVAWNSQSDFEGHLEQIITQKYIAAFPEGEEAWTEFRRTGYPRIIPTKTNQSGGKIDTDKQIRRLVYPASEYSANAENVSQAIALLGGADTGGTSVWWDKKN